MFKPYSYLILKADDISKYCIYLVYSFPFPNKYHKVKEYTDNYEKVGFEGYVIAYYDSYIEAEKVARGLVNA